MFFGLNRVWNWLGQHFLRNCESTFRKLADSFLDTGKYQKSVFSRPFLAKRNDCGLAEKCKKASTSARVSMPVLIL